jgi:ADP-glucose pyrophosphorylase
VKNNILVESKLDGIFVATGNAPDSLVAHTTITRNEMSNNARFGVFVLASLSRHNDFRGQ